MKLNEIFNKYIIFFNKGGVRYYLTDIDLDWNPNSMKSSPVFAEAKLFSVVLMADLFKLSPVLGEVFYVRLKDVLQFKITLP